MIKVVLDFKKNEPKIFRLSIGAIFLILSYVFTNKLNEVIPFGYELMVLLYDLGIGILAATIFFIYQIYIPQSKIRLFARKELARIVASWGDRFADMLLSSIDQNEMEEWIVYSSRQPTIFTSYIADQIGTYLDIKGSANINPSRRWSVALSERAISTKDSASNIAKKYNSFLSEDMLNYILEIEQSSILECMRVLPWHEDAFKRIPSNLLEDFFILLEKMNEDLELGVATGITQNTFKAQHGLIGKSRLIENA